MGFVSTNPQMRAAAFTCVKCIVIFYLFQAVMPLVDIYYPDLFPVICSISIFINTVFRKFSSENKNVLSV